MKFFTFIVLLFLPFTSFARTVSYDINVSYRTINIAGKSVKVIALGKVGETPSIPAPTLEFTEGDTAQITIHNNLNEDASIHWHGLLVPNDQDGVPGLTYPAIAAHSVFKYEFPIKQAGTYWYHSHTGLQEQRGVYGAIVINPKQETLVYDVSQVVLLSDWTNRNPVQIMNNLKTDPDYEQICKGTRRGWIDDIKEGTVKQRIQSEKGRMGPMDVSDVCYDAFLMNGKRQLKFENALPGQKIRLRFINGASSTYFHVAFGNKQPIEVVSADGMRVEPVQVSDFVIGMGETYDAIITIPKDVTSELRATSTDVTGKVSAFFGKGPAESAPDDHRPSPYMDMGSGGGGKTCPPGQHPDPSMGGMCMPDHGQAAMVQAKIKKTDEPPCEPGEPGCNDLFPLSYDMLKALFDTSLPPNSCTSEIELDLTGNMFSYVWSFNDKVLGDADLIQIEQGSNVKIKFVNKTMMHHPLHLHGHFFRLLNGQDKFSPLKHTVDIPPMGTVTIEFYADQEKKWMFHCHNLYHMTAGMGRVFSYMEPTPPARIINIDKSCTVRDPRGSAMPNMSHDSMPMNGPMSDMSGKQWYDSEEASVTNARVETKIKAVNDKYSFSLNGERSYDGNDYEVRAEGTRSINPNLRAGVGVQRDNLGSAGRAVVQYRLPYLIDTTLGVGNRGIDYSIAKEFALNNNLSFDTKYGREYGIKKYGAFLKWRYKRSLTLKAGVSELKTFELGVDYKK